MAFSIDSPGRVITVPPKIAVRRISAARGSLGGGFWAAGVAKVAAASADVATSAAKTDLTMELQSGAVIRGRIDRCDEGRNGDGRSQTAMGCGWTAKATAARP